MQTTRFYFFYSFYVFLICIYILFPELFLCVHQDTLINSNLFFNHMSESIGNFIAQGTKDLVKSFLGLLGILFFTLSIPFFPLKNYFELKLGNSDHQRFHLVDDDIHSNLVFTRWFNNSLLSLIEENSNTSHHTNSLLVLVMGVFFHRNTL